MKVQRMFNALVVIALAVALLPAQPVTAAVPAAAIPAAGDSVPGELIVEFTAAPAAARAQAAALAGDIGAQVAEVNGQMALLRLAADADLNAAARALTERRAARFAEPNRLFRIPEQSAQLAGGPMSTQASSLMTDGSRVEATLAEKKALRVLKSGKIQALYPSDRYNNWGWWFMGANIVWPDKTPGKTVCVVDTGVDYLHRDLAGNVIKGYDFVNDDKDPMDDNGHGTHVAGVIAAKTNNVEGISGISSGKVLAVKALDAQGVGSLWDIAQSIDYCVKQTGANRADVINLSLGAVGYSEVLELAIQQAYDAGKLVVAAAGNDNTSSYCPGGDLRLYPAGFATEGPTYVDASCNAGTVYHTALPNVLSVGAYDTSDTRAPFSNYGEWVQWSAPGMYIVSTTPWDRPFFLNFEENLQARYGILDGTSMAAPHVAAAAARIWAYMAKSNPSVTFMDVKQRMMDTSFQHSGNVYGWPSEQGMMYEPVMSAAMERGAIRAYVYDAAGGVPLAGATVNVYQVTGNLSEPLRGAVSTAADGMVEIINLPAPDRFRLKVSKAGYTTGLQEAFVSPSLFDGTASVVPGFYAGYGGDLFAAVPPKNSNFTGVVQWARGDSVADFDLALYIPKESTPFGPYVVSAGRNVGNSFGVDQDTIGSLSDYPRARVLYSQNRAWETITIRNRPTAAGLPFFPGVYTYRLADINWVQYLEAYQEAFLLWKDGKLLSRVNRECSANQGYWNILSITSGISGSARVQAINTCTGAPNYPANP